MNTSRVTRVEVINWKDNKGRVYVNWDEDTEIETQLQDNDRTLKIFIKDKKL